MQSKIVDEAFLFKNCNENDIQLRINYLLQNEPNEALQSVLIDYFSLKLNKTNYK